MATVTCLFASGYKFNLSWPLQFDRLLQKTGTLAVSTSPKSAEVFLNNKKQTYPGFKLFKKDFVTTPIKLKNLLPGRYILRIEKDNYWPLEKEVTIESGLTTFAEDINLFRSNLPTLVHNSENTDILISPSGNYIYLPKSQEFINLKTMSLELKAEEELKNTGSWLGNNDQFFSSGNVYNLSDKSVATLDSLVNQNVDTWKYDKDNEQIYSYSQSGTVLRIEKDRKSSTVLFEAETILDHKEDDGSLFVISEISNKKYLLEYNLSNQEELRRFELPTLGNYNFFPTSSAVHLTLYDEQNSSLYLINKEDWQKSFIINQVKGWVYIDRDRIIYHNGWEITLLNLKEDTSILLDRVSEPIDKILWHDRENYYIFSTNAGIHVGDLKTNILATLFRSENLKDIALDSKSNTLYFFADIGQQSGVYRLLLK